MIPKTLTGYNVPWPLEGNLWVNSLLTPAPPTAPGRYFGMALFMVVNNAFFLNRSSPGYQHLFPRQPLRPSEVDTITRLTHDPQRFCASEFHVTVNSSRVEATEERFDARNDQGGTRCNARGATGW